MYKKRKKKKQETQVHIDYVTNNYSLVTPNNSAGGVTTLQSARAAVANEYSAEWNGLFSMDFCRPKSVLYNVIKLRDVMVY